VLGIILTKGGGHVMDYFDLAVELLNCMQNIHKLKSQKNISEAMRGESMRGEAFVLHYIALRGCEVLPGEIGQEMDVSSARIAAALNSLEKKGLITRRIDLNDRRKILVSITGEGKDTAEKQQQAMLEFTAEMLEKLGAHDAQEYVRIMKKLAGIT
jgi:DNA-binding MarR family transcriptional regulator